MSLAIFDLDNTLLGGDSDYLWGTFLVTEGLVDGDRYERENQRFYDDYKAGSLDIMEFLAFSLAPLADIPMPRLLTLRKQFMQEVISPLLLPKAHALLDEHRSRGDRLLVITATNSFVTAPIVTAYGIDTLIATEPEMHDGRYTGRVAGIPSFQRGKVERLEQWLAREGENLADSHFYSDSLNDLPLLEQVTHPVAVDPDDTLRDHAQARGWPIISLR